MGEGLFIKCEKCGYEADLKTGVGMMFPVVYKETMEDAKKGKYGEVLQKFLNENDKGVLDIEEDLFQCKECKKFENQMNLDAYLYEHKVPEGYMVWDDWRGNDVEYVTRSDLRGLRPVIKMEHRCSSCGGVMRRRNFDVIERSVSEHRLKCPCCGELITNASYIMWD